MRLGRPRYLGSPNYRHSTEPSVGILLANLGTPAAPTAAALRPYLRQFLSDPRVIELPRLWWQILLNCIIVPFRSTKSAAAYRSVWTEDGSPLLAISRRQRDAIAAELADAPAAVRLGMSYGEPSIASALRGLHAHNCQKLIVLPLYPQYAASTVGAVFDAVSAELASWRWVPELRMIGGYCSRAGYAEMLAASISEHRAEHGTPDLTLFSFHGIQLAALQGGDPYHCQCHRTAREAAAILGLDDKEWLVAFQSRFGNDPWLQPYAIEVMGELPKRGVRNLHVVCPAFSADCLETLEEITVENKEAFMKAGGQQFSYIPALNDRPDHISFLTGLVRSEAGDWFERVAEERSPDVLEARSKRAEEVRPLTEQGLPAHKPES